MSGPGTPFDEDAQAYVDALPPAGRALFECLHGAILAEHPDARVVLAYRTP